MKNGSLFTLMKHMFIHPTQSHFQLQSIGPNSNLRTPISRGQYTIIFHARSENGFINKVLIIFNSGEKSGGFHEAMNYTNYDRDKIIPNLSPNSVFIIDNASYHNKLLNPAPKPSTKKC